MKTRIPTTAISRTLQAVATFGLLAPSTTSAATQGSTIADPSHLTESTERSASIFSELSEDQEVSSAVNFPMARDWGQKAGRRFSSSSNGRPRILQQRRRLKNWKASRICGGNSMPPGVARRSLFSKSPLQQFEATALANATAD